MTDSGLVLILLNVVIVVMLSGMSWFLARLVRQYDERMNDHGRRLRGLEDWRLATGADRRATARDAHLPYPKGA